MIALVEVASAARVVEALKSHGACRTIITTVKERRSDHDK
jgi:hypothetical protein